MVRESQSPYQPRAKKSTGKPSKALRFSSPDRPRRTNSVVSTHHLHFDCLPTNQLLSPASSAASGYETGSGISAVDSGPGQDDRRETVEDEELDEWQTQRLAWRTNSQLTPLVLPTPGVSERRSAEEVTQGQGAPAPTPGIGHKSFGKGIRITNKPKKYRPRNPEALRQIRIFEKAVGIKEAIPTRSFQRQVKQVVEEQNWKDFKFQAGALRAMQQASEALLISLFEDMNLCSQHDRRVTVMPRDMVLSRRLRRNI